MTINAPFEFGHKSWFVTITPVENKSGEIWQISAVNGKHKIETTLNQVCSSATLKTAGNKAKMYIDDYDKQLEAHKSILPKDETKPGIMNF